MRPDRSLARLGSAPLTPPLSRRAAPSRPALLPRCRPSSGCVERAGHLQTRRALGGLRGSWQCPAGPQGWAGTGRGSGGWGRGEPCPGRAAVALAASAFTDTQILWQLPGRCCTSPSAAKWSGERIVTWDPAALALNSFQPAGPGARRVAGGPRVPISLQSGASPGADLADGTAGRWATVPRAGPSGARARSLRCRGRAVPAGGGGAARFGCCCGAGRHAGCCWCLPCGAGQCRPAGSGGLGPGRGRGADPRGAVVRSPAPLHKSGSRGGRGSALPWKPAR